MSIESNITVADKFFLGEDKYIDFTIFDQDETTPYDITVNGLSLAWSLRKTDKDIADPLLYKTLGDGLSIIGVYDVLAETNTQRLRLTFSSEETSTILKPNVAYRHSLKRTDSGNEGILAFGSITFLQATEH